MFKRNTSFFRIILMGMMLLLCITLLPVFGYLYAIKLPSRLNRNACDILQKQVDNRQTYLEDILLKNHNLQELSNRIDLALETLVASGKTTVETIDSDSEASAALLQDISQDLIQTLRSKDVTGIFVVLNTKDMDTLTEDTPLQGIYIRDLDPDAADSFRNADLFLERSPVQLVQSLFISTDKSWYPYVRCGSPTSCNFMYPAFQAAYKDHAVLEASDYGHLTTSPYTLTNDTRSAMAYSIPLITSDGTVYGVLGVEMLSSYLQSMMPAEELENEETGTYLLAYSEDGALEEKVSMHAAICSAVQTVDESQSLELTLDGETQGWLTLNEEKQYAAILSLNIYNRNTPFAHEQWYLIGSVPVDQLFSFSNELATLLGIAFIVSLILGIICCMAFSLKLANPIFHMYKELQAAKQQPDKIPVFAPTRVRELEQFSTAITTLSKDIVDTSTKFLQIMEMASVDLGGYEIRYDTQSVYVTENFFTLLAISPDALSEKTVEQFRRLLKELDKKHTGFSSPTGGKVYHIVDNKGNVRYIHMKKTYLENSQIGVVEDQTEIILDRMRIQQERDYDLLTSIYNRRAVERNYQKLFDKPEELKYAATMMLDLDNLKSINDTFGHDYGDQYIQLAGKCFIEGLPENALYGRISGDEFFVFLYGYETKEALQSVVDAFAEFVHKQRLVLPNGEVRGLGISGGIAWYGEHGTEPTQLKKCADAALYEMKNTHKGTIGIYTPGE